MLDRLDVKILKELRTDARMAATRISRKLGEARTTIQHRIDRMREKGVIRKIIAIPDYSKIGLPVTAFVLVTFDPSCGLSQQEVAAKIAKIEKVSEVHVVAGQWDIILKARGATLQEIGELVVNQLRQIHGVGQTITSGCFFTLKDEP